MPKDHRSWFKACAGKQSEADKGLYLHLAYWGFLDIYFPILYLLVSFYHYFQHVGLMAFPCIQCSYWLYVLFLNFSTCFYTVSRLCSYCYTYTTWSIYGLLLCCGSMFLQSPVQLTNTHLSVVFSISVTSGFCIQPKIF